MLIQYSYFNIRYSNINRENANSFMILFWHISFSLSVSFIPFICQSFLAVPSVKLNDLVLRGNGLKVRENSASPLSGRKKCSPGVMPSAFLMCMMHLARLLVWHLHLLVSSIWVCNMHKMNDSGCVSQFYLLHFKNISIG